MIHLKIYSQNNIIPISMTFPFLKQCCIIFLLFMFIGVLNGIYLVNVYGIILVAFRCVLPWWPLGHDCALSKSVHRSQMLERLFLMNCTS